MRQRWRFSGGSSSQAECDLSVIDDAFQAAFEAGMDRANGGDPDVDKQNRTSVEQNLKNFLKQIKGGFGKSGLPVTDIRELWSLAKRDPEADPEVPRIGDQVTVAFLKGAEFAMRERGLVTDGPLWLAVESSLNDFRVQLEESLCDANRVGTQALNFLKSETSSIRKKALKTTPCVPIQDAGTRIDRQVKQHLRILRDKGILISRRGPNRKDDLFWGLKKWGTDEDFWAKSTAIVDEAELAAGLPEFGGRPKTNGLIDNARLNTYLPMILRRHGLSLMTRHFCNVVKLKTTVPVTREERIVDTEKEYCCDLISELADPRSTQFSHELEVCDMMDKEPIGEELRDYWATVRRYPDNYLLALEELKVRGWENNQITKCKSSLLKLRRTVEERIIRE